MMNFAISSCRKQIELEVVATAMEVEKQKYVPIVRTLNIRFSRHEGFCRGQSIVEPTAS